MTGLFNRVTDRFMHDQKLGNGNSSQTYYAENMYNLRNEPTSRNYGATPKSADIFTFSLEKDIKSKGITRLT